MEDDPETVEVIFTQGELFDYYAGTPNAFIDTAELYGLGKSERLVGDFQKAAGKQVRA